MSAITPTDPPPAEARPVPKSALPPNEALNAILDMSASQDRRILALHKEVYSQRSLLEEQLKHLKWISFPIRIIFILFLLWLVLNVVLCVVLVLTGTLGGLMGSGAGF